MDLVAALTCSWSWPLAQAAASDSQVILRRASTVGSPLGRFARSRQIAATNFGAVRFGPKSPRTGRPRQRQALQPTNAHRGSRRCHRSWHAGPGVRHAGLADWHGVRGMGRHRPRPDRRLSDVRISRGPWVCRIWGSPSRDARFSLYLTASEARLRWFRWTCSAAAAVSVDA
jgi:hypothetical protein